MFELVRGFDKLYRWVVKGSTRCKKNSINPWLCLSGTLGWLWSCHNAVEGLKKRTWKGQIAQKPGPQPATMYSTCSENRERKVGKTFKNQRFSPLKDRLAIDQINNCPEGRNVIGYSVDPLLDCPLTLVV